MRVLVILCLTSLHAATVTGQLCNAGQCSCEHTRGKFICSCPSPQTQEVILGPTTVPDNSVHIRIENCSDVHVMPRTWEHHHEVRHLEFYNIEKLNLEGNAFSWNETVALEPVVPLSGVEVVIVNSNVPEIPSYTFKGRLTGITLHNVTIGTIYPFAFASLYNTEKLEIIDCNVQTFSAQAFKKFSMKKLHISGGHFINDVPSRTMTDIEVQHSVVIEGVKFNTIKSSAFIIHEPKSFHLSNNYFHNVEGEAFHIKMLGKVVIQNNVFLSLQKGAFLQINVVNYILKQKGPQNLVFQNNTITNFENGCLNFNSSSFEAKLNQVTLNQTCSCVLLDSWKTQLYIDSSGQQQEQQNFHHSNNLDHFRCQHDSENNHRSYISFQEFNQQCVLTTGLHVFLIVIIIASIVLLVVVLIVIFICCRQRNYQSHWINVPTSPNNVGKKTKVNTKDNYKDSRSKSEPDSRITMVVPDGRIYRETELHVIVERAEPLVQHEYVDTGIDEHTVRNRV